MEDSILLSVKKLLGIDSEDMAFDIDLKMHINTVFVILRQLGVTKNSFIITDDETTWSDYLGDNTNLEDVKSYVCLKVRALFDPPTSGTLNDSLNALLSELEWRISATADYGEGISEDDDV